MNIIKTNLSLTALPEIGPVLSSMLKNVKNMTKKKQLFSFTCFIIHVGLDRIGVNAYA